MYVDIEEYEVPLTLRLRVRGLSAEARKRLRVSEFCMEIEQVEDYQCCHPELEQPPKKPLLTNHPLRNIYEVGLADCIPPGRVGMRAFSLLPEGTSFAPFVDHTQPTYSRPRILA
ncbi:hypothetical protein OBBRIDRAFT_840037 [Obba rivulosa]|uniref:Uncharacterized protein n=1 Tax=Obba rivulosa TaxID=1052685 RepID=A0A8E2ALE8_9APHY|nr:hypothetical protein OBBRIDRAFT_840037 [Obba rivulosa]